MSLKLYIGNLAFQTSHRDLFELFGRVGTVKSVSVIENRETGRSRGYGFVEMSTVAEGRAAIKQFNGTRLSGRIITVNEATRPHSQAQVKERIIEGPDPIERTLFLASQPIAVAYLDASKSEASLAWPLAKGTDLEDILDLYLRDFLSVDRSQPIANYLEFWIGNSYHEMSIGTIPTVGFVMDTISSRRRNKSDRLNLLQISSNSVVMELLFNPDEPGDHPTRMALVISSVQAEALGRLFSRFHRNEIVSRNLEFVLPGLGQMRQLFKAFQKLLRPSRLYSEKTHPLDFDAYRIPLAAYMED